ncbi:MAG: nucleoside kinase [Bacteroidaceae bacterium]|nr:nucleoside kinase [Bacteroidaceae bacterium]
MDMELSIRNVNDGKVYKLPEGKNLLDLLRTFVPDRERTVMAAKVNNVLRGLDYRLYHNSDVEFVGLDSVYGMRTYTHTLLFILSKAVADLCNGVEVSVEAPISNGYYIRLRNVEGRTINATDVRRAMDKLIARDIPFERHECPTDEAIAMYQSCKRDSKVILLKTTGNLYTTYYTLEDYPDNYYSPLCPSTGWIKTYGVEKYHDGLLLRLPDPERPDQLKPFVTQNKMLEIFNEYHRWQDLGSMRTIGELNDICAKGHTSTLIDVSEALQEKKICHIAEDIERRGTVKMVLIAGPSSSGKTTFSKRLSVQLMTCGLRPRAISLDDYFLPRSQTPRDASGDYDYETIDALNLPLLAEQMKQLFQGEEVELPRYDFHSGESLPSGNRIKLLPNDVLVIEGIHALNPKLTATIDNKYKYKVYVSALTTMQLDDHNYISPSDNRLLRRIVRDDQFRGTSAADTIARWPSVRAGERKWIYPFAEKVDAMFNSALLFELAGLRAQVMPLLERVPENVPEYTEAHRLRTFLGYINPINIKTLPSPSLLREFLGGSSFHY